MKTGSIMKGGSTWKDGLLCLAFTMLGYLHFAGLGSKWITLAALLGIIVMLALRGREKRCTLPTLLLCAYALFSWLTVFWAMAGKFHLREFSKVITALAVFFFIALRERMDRAFARRVMGIVSGVSALYAFLSVEAASIGLSRLVLPGAGGIEMGFNGARMNGIFGNANIEASIFAIGIFFSLALLCGAAEKRERILFAVTLSFNAFAFLLAFSMGAIVCFAAAVLVYLVAAGKSRGAVLVRMLEAAAPTLVFVFLAARFFNRDGLAFVPLTLMLLNAAVTTALELSAAEKLGAVFGEKQKLTFVFILAAVVLCAAYVGLGATVTGAYTFGEPLARSAVLAPGEHTLYIDADGEVNSYIYSQNRLELLQYNSDADYDGTETEITFTVPQDAEITNFAFSAEEGVVLRSAVLDGQKTLPLYYRLLPGFIGIRIQNLTANRSQIERRIFWEDGMKLFRRSPLVGNGVGAFETGATAVQDYFYETKYVHNHYIQVLLEDGVIGFTLYLGALLALAAALWKKRKQAAQGEFTELYGALCAEFVMSCAQMFWDVSMSCVVFTCMAYATYGLIVGTCAEPLKKREDAEAPAKQGKQAKKKARQSDALSPVRIGGIALSACVALTLCGNLYANSLSSRPVTVIDAFFRNQDTAVRLDFYERNDAKLSYVLNAADVGQEIFIARANDYAAQLAAVQSNTIPRKLVAYYLQTEQYAAAIDEAMLGATYSATDAETWNRCAALLKQAFFDSGEASPLQSDDGSLAGKLQEYRAMLQAHNAAALMPVEPDETAQAFFEQVGALAVK